MHVRVCFLCHCRCCPSTASTLLPAVVYSLTRRAKLQEGVRHVPGQSPSVFRKRGVDAAAQQATARRQNLCAAQTGGSPAGPPHGTAGVLLTSRMHTGLCVCILCVWPTWMASCDPSQPHNGPFRLTMIARSSRHRSRACKAHFHMAACLSPWRPDTPSRRLLDTQSHRPQLQRVWWLGAGGLQCSRPAS